MNHGDPRVPGLHPQAPHQHQHYQHHPIQNQHQGPPQKWHSFKMLVDPMIHAGAPKMVRYDGSVVPGNPHHVPPTPSDPRKKLPNSLWKRLEAMDLPVPKLKIDENYVGEPPKVEVTIENLNDNVDKQFLRSMVAKFGPIEEMSIYFHPINKKHLGLARLVFEEVRSAKECVKSLHGKSVMGKQLNCYIDPYAASCKQMFEELTTEKKVEPVELLSGNADDSPEEIEDVPTLTEKNNKHEIMKTKALPPSPGGGLLEDSSSSLSRWESSSGRKSDKNKSRDPRDSSRDPRDSSRDSLRRSSDHRTHVRRRSDNSSRDFPNSRDSSRGGHKTDHVSRTNSVDNENSNSNLSVNIPQIPPPPLPNAVVPLNDPSQQQAEYHPSEYYHQPDYWLQKAQQFAAQAALAAQESQDSGKPEQNDQEQQQQADHEGHEVENNTIEVEEKKEEEDQHKLDLDTRLKMLMKDRSGAMPAFLLEELNGSESDHPNDHQDGEVEEMTAAIPSVFPLLPDEVPLDRPPSPFLSAEIYLQSHQDWLEEKRKNSQKSKSKSNNQRSGSRNSDQMSLSSLSSAENTILEQSQPDPNAVMGYPPYGYYPPGYPGGQYPPGYGDPYAQHYMQHPDQYHQLPGGGDPNQYYGLDQQWQHDQHENNQNTDIQTLINDCVTAFVKDLKRTLRKDIQKRMCETLAFTLFDKWWQEQEEKYKSRMRRQQSKSITSKTPSTSGITPLSKLSSTSNANAITSTPTETVIKAEIPSNLVSTKAEDVSSIFDKQRQKFESSANSKSGGVTGIGGLMGGSLGFGFRGAIPKLPSFKKKRSTADNDKRRKGGSVETSEDEEESRSRGKNRSKKYEKRKDYEKRRQDRMSSSKHKDNLKEEKVSSSSNNKNEKDQSSTLKKRTLGSMLSAIYSDESGDNDLLKSSDSEMKIPNKVQPSKTKVSQNAKRKKSPDTWRSGSSKSSSSKSNSENEEEENSDSQSSSSFSQQVSNSAKSSSSSSSSSSSASSSSSSSSSSSESEIEDVKSKKLPPKMKEVAKKDQIIGEEEESSDLQLGLEESEEEQEKDSEEKEIEIRKEKAESSEEDLEKKVKPVPIRRPSLQNLQEIQKQNVPDVVSSPHIMDHCYAKPSSEIDDDSKLNKNKVFEDQFALDHGYTKARTPPRPKTPTPTSTDEVKETLQKALLSPNNNKSVLNLNQAKRFINTKTFKPRDTKEQFGLTFKFLTQGLDLEDINYLKRSYEKMLNDQDSKQYWVNDTHWVDHTITDIPDPPKKKSRNDFSRPHLTGSCRTEGYYKMDPREKARTKYHLLRSDSDLFASIKTIDGSATKGRLQTAQNLSREARSTQRRTLAVLGEDVINSDLLKFNQLKFRRKQMIFGKSAIHDWGLFALEDIGADEMVIEYVGQVIRPVLSDVREVRYQKQGIGSSYLFRIDQDNVVDATKKGNLARFINHSCDPNCYAKVITVDQERKIVIYSKQPIGTGEEITYDYKFEIEDEKIRCLCGSRNCRKYLN